MNTYETMILLDNREVKKGWDALKSDVATYFTKHNAEIVSARRWDERRLAYEIKHQLRGTYLLVYYKAPASDLPSIRRELDYSEKVLRHLTQVCADIPEEAHEPEAEFDENEVPLGDEPEVSEEKAEEPKAEEAKADDAKADDAKADDAKADDAKADDAKADDAKAEAGDGEATEAAAPEATATEGEAAPEAAPAEETEK